MSGPGVAFPHAAHIQESFGHHGIGHFRAHLDAKAQAITKASQAKGMTKGPRSAFASSSPSKHTAAHEAAHAKVFELAHVSVPGNVGSVGDPHEQLADQIADRVVAGRSATDLLDSVATGPTARKGAPTAKKPLQFLRDEDGEAHVSQFDPRSLSDEYTHASTLGRAGLVGGGWARGLVRGGHQGFQAGYDAAGGGVTGTALGTLGGIGGAAAGTVSGLLQGVGGGLSDAYTTTRRQMDKNPVRTTAGLGLAGGIGLNSALAGSSVGAAAYQGANASVGSIVGGASNVIRSGAAGYRWHKQGKHLQNTEGNLRSVGRGLHNVSKVTTSAVHAGKWIDKARGATLQGGSGASWFNHSVTPGATAGSQSLATLSNIGAVSGIVSGSLDMIRGGVGAYKHSQRNRQLGASIGKMNTPMTDKESAAVAHVKKHNNKKFWENTRRGIGGAMITSGSALTATGVGAPVGSAMVMAGMAAQSAPEAWKKAKQYRRNMAEARRTMTHADWVAEQDQKIAKNKQRSKGAGLMTRLSYWTKRKGLEYKKWMNKGGWKDPSGPPQSYADWKSEKMQSVNARTATTGLGLAGGASSALKGIFGEGGYYHRNKFKGTSIMGRIGSAVGNAFFGAGLGLGGLLGGAAAGLGRSIHRRTQMARAGLFTTANWDKSDRKKKAEHVNHARAFLDKDGNETATGGHALDALGLGKGKYRGNMNGRELLAKSAGHAAWADVPAEDKAKLIARVMRKGGVQEAAVGLREKRESDAYAHKRMLKRVADSGAGERHKAYTATHANMITDKSGANLSDEERNANPTAMHGVEGMELKKDYRNALESLHGDSAMHGHDEVEMLNNPSSRAEAE